MPDVQVVTDISNDEFRQEFFETQTPVVIRGGVSHWPAVERWTPEYLTEALGESVDVLAAAGGDHFDPDVTPYNNLPEFPMATPDFVDAVFGPTPDSLTHYLRQKSLKDYATLREDVLDPTLVDAPEFASQVWIGAAGNVTNTHFDTDDNFLAQVSGSKNLQLFPSKCFADMYPYPARTPMSANYSMVNVIDPDLERHARFAQVERFDAHLDPGDMLYIPIFWWHRVETVEAGAAVNFWWLENGRRRWRRQFFHYIPTTFRVGYPHTYLRTLVGLQS